MVVVAAEPLGPGIIIIIPEMLTGFQMFLSHSASSLTLNETPKSLLIKQDQREVLF